MEKDAANENSGLLEMFGPDSVYVEDYLKKTTAHFEECGISSYVVGWRMIEAFLKVLPGNPDEKLPDAGDLHAGLVTLSATIMKLEGIRDDYREAQKRIDRRLCQKFAEEYNCTEEEAFFRIWDAKHPVSEAAKDEFEQSSQKPQPKCRPVLMTADQARMAGAKLYEDWLRNF